MISGHRLLRLSLKVVLLSCLRNLHFSISIRRDEVPRCSSRAASLQPGILPAVEEKVSTGQAGQAGDEKPAQHDRTHAVRSHVKQMLEDT